MKPISLALMVVGALSASPALAQIDVPVSADLQQPDAETTKRTAGQVQSVLIASRLLEDARKTRESKGCAPAAPNYRVVAAMGEGQEAAQHELGECLLTIAGADASETALFRQEGLFWLTRAAHAGNARAQRALAIHYAAPAEGAQEEALKWALVYARNSDAAVYGYKDLPATFTPGLIAALAPHSVADAQAFAAAFAPRAMARFDPPPPPKGSKSRSGPGDIGAQQPTGRGRR